MSAEPSRPVGQAWLPEPSGLAQLGILLLILVGGLALAASALYALLILLFRGQPVEGALALAVAAVGLTLVVQGLRALDAAHWQRLTLPLGAGPALLVVVWLLGLATEARLGAAGWAFALLIPAAAGLASLTFLSAALRGLRAPAGRPPAGDLAPRHVVLLSAATSAAFATLLSILLEGLFLAVVGAILLSMTRLLGDPLTLEMIERAVQSADPLTALEEIVARSPAALAALGCIMVFVAPAIEETVKGLPLFVFARRPPRLNERTAILLGVAGGVGFAFVENVGYLGMLTGSWGLALWLRVGAAVMHGAASGLVGRAWYRGRAQGRWRAMLLDLAKAWAAHGLWNALALLAGWFTYREMTAGVLWCLGAGVLPLALMFTLMAGWGIWVSEDDRPPFS